MTSQHRQILRRNVDSLHRIDLDKLVAHLSALLDDEDKQNLCNMAKPAYERVDMLLTEVLPRRGPTAFHSFVQGLEKVDPSIAQSLQQEAGMKGINKINNNIGWCLPLLTLREGEGRLPC